MFEKLRNALSSAVKSLGEKELKEKDIDEVLFELEVALLESDVATEVIDSIKSDLKKQLVGVTVQKDTIPEFVKQNLRQSISNMFDMAGTIDLLSQIKKNKEKNEPYIILFMGINGTGKTTTIAKFANLLRENKFSSVIAAADTYRAGAIEQIVEHGKRLNIKVISQNYGSDPAAVSRDAVLYAKSHKIDCVLIDTAGRMQTSKNLMDQISKINKVVNPHIRIFVGDSLAGNDTVSQAREFHNYTKFDGAILTKSDADARGGAAISVVKITSSPILYLGIGQEYGDLKSFDKGVFLDSLFGSKDSSEEIFPSTKTSDENLVQQELLINQNSPESKSEQRFVEPEIKTINTKLDSQITSVQTEDGPKEEPLSESLMKKENEESEQRIMEETREIDKEDPFAGIPTQDIEKYSEFFNVSPPENDNEAVKLADKIRKWISDGRSKPQNVDEEIDKIKTNGLKDVSVKEEKKSKKRSMFGWMKK